MSESTATHDVYRQGVRPPVRSAMSETIAAMRNAPRHEREEFWTAMREAISEELAPEAPAYRPTARQPKPSLVYYLRFGDRVKIGYTTNLPERLKAIPHDEVLATEPGTIQDERARHIAFADLRVTGEWFRFEEPLVSHIAGLQ